MVCDLARHVETLSRTPRVVRELLEGVDEAIATAGYGDATFSPYHVVGHLIIGEREDWIPRARIILAHGVDRPFDPFPHRGTIEPEEGPALGELLDQFASLRAANLAALASMDLDERKLRLEGMHPSLGRVTLAQLIATWATHDLHHITQICKGLSFQNRLEVGPWRAFLGVIPPG